jgi:hypothetical protein
MGVSRQSIKSLYRLSLVEQEGIGTAYEYYAKLKKLSQFLRAVGTPRKVLVLGLPERYGFSMDFVLLAEQLQAEVVVVDERPERVHRAQQVLGELVSKQVLSGKRTRFEVVEDLTDFAIGEDGELFDMALSCEVLQRLDLRKDQYFKTLWRTSKNLALFVPNGMNRDHATHSGLRSLHLRDLRNYCLLNCNNLRIYGSGYLDMPPFPPGITRSQEKRDHAASSRLEGLLMDILDGCCTLEPLWPDFAKSKFAHIAYVMAGRRL